MKILALHVIVYSIYTFPVQLAVPVRAVTCVAADDSGRE